MFKKLLLALVAVVAINTISYAQDEAVVVKGMSFYICGGTGNINPDAGKVLDAWSETGVTYSQNFASAPWFTVSTTAAICGVSPGIFSDDDEFLGSAPVDYAVTGYGKVNASFGKYFAFGISTVGRFDFDIKYALALPANQRLTFKTYIEVFPTGSSFYGTKGTAGSAGDFDPLEDDPTKSATRNVLAHMDYRITYYVQFHPQWGYESDVRFRFNGGSSDTAKADSIQALKESFSVRWNNTLYFSNASGFGGYLQFRYQPQEILMGAANVKHIINLSAGLSYAYDLSAL